MAHALKAGLVSLLLIAAAVAADVTGTWNFTVETDQGSGNPTFVFKQDGEKLTGTYTGMFGQAPVSGTVKGDRIEFKMDVEAQGQKLTVTYSGQVDNGTQMKGKAVFGDYGSGTWTAKKK